MSESNNKKREIDLGDDFNVAVTVNGVRIEFDGGGDVYIRTRRKGMRVVCLSGNDDQSIKPKASPEIGNVMADGTVYAGVSPDTGEALYAMPQDAPMTMKWQEAAMYALCLDAHGHKDWRLPTRAELNVLYQNRRKGTLKDTFLEARGYGNTSCYWSCTTEDFDSSRVYGMDFSCELGFGSWTNKDGFRLSMRPVRAERQP